MIFFYFWGLLVLHISLLVSCLGPKMDCGGKNCKFGGGNLPQVEMVKQLPSEAQEFFAKHKLILSVCCCLPSLDCNLAIDCAFCEFCLNKKVTLMPQLTWDHIKISGCLRSCCSRREISRWWFRSLLYYHLIKHFIYIFVPIPACRSFWATSVMILFSAGPMPSSHSGFAGRSIFCCMGQMDLKLFCFEHWAQ